MIMTITFSKYQGLGNDFILIDNRESALPIISPDQAIILCDRHFGIGADGVIFLLPKTNSDTDYTMRIFNSDGSEPEMCGNGIRCLARFIADLDNKQIEQTYRIDTLAGVITTYLESSGQITVDMGAPQLNAEQIPTIGFENQKVINQPLLVGNKVWTITCVSMGNPHCITFVDNVDSIDLEKIGTDFEHHQAFPKRINAEFIEILSPSHTKMRVWERGAGITLACGTGACASVVAGVLTERTQRRCKVDLPGGQLEIYWSQEDGKVYMTGPSKKVFVGEYQLISQTPTLN